MPKENAESSESLRIILSAFGIVPGQVENWCY